MGFPSKYIMAIKNKLTDDKQIELQEDSEIILEQKTKNVKGKANSKNVNKKSNHKNKTKGKYNPKNNSFNEATMTKAQLCEKFYPKITQTRYTQIMIIAVVLSFAISYLYMLSIPFAILIALAMFFFTRTALVEFCRNKYESKKIEDVASYIEQMLYSFRRNSKILASLQDTITIFGEGEMRDTIQSAIDHIIQSYSAGNIYEEALEIIQKKYDCRRIRSLHRFLTKVEGVGGDHEIGVQALINDRRMWLERFDDYKKERSSILKEIIISCLFSSIICAVTMRMLPSYVGAMQHIATRIGSTLYIIINMFTVSSTFKKTVFYLNDMYTKDEQMALLTKFRWFRTWDKKTEQKKGLRPAIILVALGALAIFLGFWWMFPITLLLGLFIYFVQPIMRHNSARKSITREIEMAFPDWLMEISLLLQTENLHVALEKTVDNAPMMLKDDLTKLGNDIASYPTEVFPYIDFLHDIDVPNIHSSMKLLYSIATFGSEEEEKQISELIERNASLMNKAEQLKNSGRLARVYIFKFIPMGASALKLIMDMGVFLVMFITQSLTAL